MQLDLFSDEDVLSSVDLERLNAKVYSAMNIYKCSGRSRIIDNFLANNDITQAFKEFDKAFKTYGFSNVNGYAFSAYQNKGKIRYFTNEKAKHIENVSSNELFNLLLKNK